MLERGAQLVYVIGLVCDIFCSSGLGRTRAFEGSIIDAIDLKYSDQRAFINTRHGISISRHYANTQT